MYAETTSDSWPPHATSPWTGLSAPYEHVRPALPREHAWRQLPGDAHHGMAPILASWWVDERTTARVERSIVAADRYIVGVALRPVRIRLGRGPKAVYDGMMPTGMVHVTEPGQAVEAEFAGPCDFIHFHVAAITLRDRQAAAGAENDGGKAAGQRPLRNLLIRDELAAQLSRSLTGGDDGGDPLYTQSIGQTMLMRVLALRQPAPRVGALTRWRLRRVQEYVSSNISEPISLADLVEAAGLSQMHFAAKFRVATGYRPHDYLQQQRIERAKQLLAGTDTPLVEVALSVGFQTQSHFSTVFKRLAGDTPGRWQRRRPAN